MLKSNSVKKGLPFTYVLLLTPSCLLYLHFSDISRSKTIFFIFFENIFQVWASFNVFQGFVFIKSCSMQVQSSAAAKSFQKYELLWESMKIPELFLICFTSIIFLQTWHWNCVSKKYTCSISYWRLSLADNPTICTIYLYTIMWLLTKP